MKSTLAVVFAVGVTAKSANNLTPTQFESSMKDNGAIVMYSMSWCPACAEVLPFFVPAMKAYSNTKDVLVAHTECDQDKDSLGDMCTYHSVETIPSIWYHGRGPHVAMPGVIAHGQGSMSQLDWMQKYLGSPTGQNTETDAVQVVEQLGVAHQYKSQNAGVPWMCDCVGNADHCGSQSQAETDACPDFVRIAAAFGFHTGYSELKNFASLMDFDPESSHTIGNFCSWGGVRCDWNRAPVNGVWSVQWIDRMLQSKVQFTIPAEVNEWKGLELLELSGLTGTIPELNLPNLRDLYLPNNHLSGPFPRGRVPELWRLNLANNELTGTLPSGLDKTMPKLVRLDVQGNQFTGRIPDDIPFFNQTDLPSASVLCDFSGNDFTCPMAEHVKKGPFYHCTVPDCETELVV